MHNKKWFTWLLITAILFLPLPALFRYLQTFIVRNAVVTAHLYDVHAPIAGVVATLHARPGTVPAHSPLVVLQSTRLPQADIDILEARYHERCQTHELLQKEFDEINIRLSSGHRKLSEYRTMLQQDLDQTTDILKARLDGEEARLKKATQIRMRSGKLLQPYALSQADIEGIDADFFEADAMVTSTRLAQKQIEHRRQMLEYDLFPSDLSDGVLQIQNQIHSLSMAILECKRRIRISEADLAVDTASLQSAREDMERLSTAVVTLPDSAVIWDVAVKTGMEVNKGDRILSYFDRSRLMVDVAMDDSTIALIQAGHRVRIRLFGSGRFIDGKVVSVMGSAASRPDGQFAAGVKGKSMRDGRVLVEIEDPELYRDVSRFCGVGRSAYAEFEGIGLVEQYLGSFKG